MYAIVEMLKPELENQTVNVEVINQAIDQRLTQLIDYAEQKDSDDQASQLQQRFRALIRAQRKMTITLPPGTELPLK